MHAGAAPCVLVCELLLKARAPPRFLPPSAPSLWPVTLTCLPCPPYAAAELEADEEPEPAPRRGLRSLGPVHIPVEGSAPVSAAPSGAGGRAC